MKCQKCSYVTNTQNELVYHMDNTHKQICFKCDSCPETFMSSEALVMHIAQKHTRFQNKEISKTSIIESQINCLDWSCSFCGEKIQGKEVRDNHICQEHPFRLGKNKTKEECRRGAGCHHWRAGTCWFAHVQDVEKHSGAEGSTRSTRRSDMWCSYQDKCDRRQLCEFRHIDEEKVFIENVLRGAGM